MDSYGLVFKLDGKKWLAHYENGEIDMEETGNITDEIGVYDNLELDCFSLVKIESIETPGEYVTDLKNLIDLQTISVANDKYPKEKALAHLLNDEYFPEFAREVLSGYLENEQENP